jgi:hypothetical protein
MRIDQSEEHVLSALMFTNHMSEMLRMQVVRESQLMLMDL